MVSLAAAVLFVIAPVVFDEVTGIRSADHKRSVKQMFRILLWIGWSYECETLDFRRIQTS
jgi:hypothetical protein